MTRSDPSIRTVVAIALLLIVNTLSASAAEEAERDAKIRVAVMNIENNSNWHYWGDNLGYAAADELVTQLFKTG